MKILALDTSTEYCSVALWREGEIDARDTLAGQRHSELALGMADVLLRHHGLALRGLDGIAYGAGPGSFTGLRIACGLTQGLAFGAGLPVVGVSTLLAMAQAVAAERVVACLDARMSQVYHAAFEKAAGGWSTVHAAGLFDPAEVPALPSGGQWTGCGSGFREYRAVLAQRHAGRWSAIIPEVYPHARQVAQLAVPEFERGAATPAEAALPVYIRDKVALRSDER